MLGPLEVRCAGQPIALGGATQRAVLAFLLVHRERRVSLDALIEAVWPDATPDGAAKRAQVAIARLRRALEPAADAVSVDTLAGGYRLRLAPGALDADVFEVRVDGGLGALAAGDAQTAAHDLGAALAMWSGPALGDLADRDFARLHAAELEARRLAALEARIEANLQLGGAGRLIGELETLFAANPERETIAAQLMRALYAAGRQADALDVFRRVREHLVDTLGLEPGPALHDLQRRILAHELAPPPAPGAEARPLAGQLPAIRAPIGRDGEIEALAALLGAPTEQLITVTGPGGVGKTTVALAVAHRLARTAGREVAFVDLSAVTDPAVVSTALLDALGIAGATEADAVDRLAARLAREQQLLVVDNLEHLLGAAGLLGTLIDRCSTLQVLATSRVPLRLRRERRWPLDPLTIAPDDASTQQILDAPATALFVARASARDPGFDAGADWSAVATLCERTGGLPLAIELAAARVGMLSPAEIAERISAEPLDLPLDLVDAPRRHRSLRATLDWSHALLSDAQRDAFERFAAFSGGAPPDLAADVTGAALEELEALIAHGMLVRRGGVDGRSRLVMLEPVRQFGAERLGRRADRVAVHARHADRYATLAGDGRVALFGRDWATWRDRLADELANFRAALRWSIDNERRDIALRLVTGLRKFWDLWWLTLEGYQWTAEALNVPGETDPRLEARATLGSAAFAVPGAITFDQAADAAQRAAEMFRRCGDASGEAEALLSLAMQLAHLDRHADARALVERARRLAPDEPRLRAMAMQMSIQLAETFEDAEALARTAIAEMRRTGVHLINETAVLGQCGSKALVHERYAEALTLLDEAIVVARATDDAPRRALARGDQGCAALALDDEPLAVEAFTDELDTCRRLGYFELLGEAALGFAALAARRGEIERAAVLAGAALEALARWGTPLHPALERIVERDLEPAREAAADEWRRHTALGARLSEHQIVDFALSDTARAGRDTPAPSPAR
jgi:predicted ATPase/DNA-binding SARP family transcriptional activator